jgi:hypothetical protein
MMCCFQIFLSFITDVKMIISSHDTMFLNKFILTRLTLITVFHSISIKLHHSLNWLCNSSSWLNHHDVNIELDVLKVNVFQAWRRFQRVFYWETWKFCEDINKRFLKSWWERLTRKHIDDFVIKIILDESVVCSVYWVVIHWEHTHS